MEQDKMCPLVKDKCIYESCMWYIPGFEKCAVAVLVCKINNLLGGKWYAEKHNSR